MLTHIRRDLPAGIVVFFVAVPLCLGIALASGAPLISGLVAGVVGGVVVGAISGSQVGVSGPAAGLAAIVVVAINDLGAFDVFLVSVVIAGLFQLALGVLRAGVIGYFFPSSVIKGMLTGIGIIIILKQIPHFFGYDASPQGDFAFRQLGGETTLSALIGMLDHISVGATVIAVTAMAILLLWELILTKRHKIFQLIQGPLVAVAVGIVFYAATPDSSILAISTENLVNVPVADSFSSFTTFLTFPDFSALTNPTVWLTGLTIAIVASLETLLCVEATDKLDPEKRVTPTNRELLAQGTGNVCSGLVGGLPVTQVIVRSSANIQSGAKTKLSAILHGVLLLGFVLLAPRLLNMIPLSVLAAILFVVGYKLAKPALFGQMFRLGWSQFAPFTVTVLGIVFTDLLVGIAAGLSVSVVMILYNNFKNSHFLHIEESDPRFNAVKMTLAEEVTFFNKAAILNELDQLSDGTYLTLDVSNTRFLDHDVIEILDDFSEKAKHRNINIKLITKNGYAENPASYASPLRQAS